MDPSLPPLSFPLAALAAPGLRLLTGPRSLLRAGLAWTLAGLPPPARLLVLDGGGRIDARLLAEAAACLGEAPCDLLARIRLAPAPTLERLVRLVEAAGAAAPRAGERHALVLAPLDLAAGGCWRAGEGDRLLERLQEGLERLGRPPRSAVVVCAAPPPDRDGGASGPAGPGRAWLPEDRPDGASGEAAAAWSAGARARLVARLAGLARAHYRFGPDRLESLTLTAGPGRRSAGVG